MTNYNYFDSIDTEEKAYWLGFIFADGNISKPYKMVNGKQKNGTYRLEVSLCSEDYEHLDKLRVALNIDKPLNVTKTNYAYSQRCRLYFQNKHMWSTLNSYGCTPQKSLTLRFPNPNIFKDKKLIKHFIRGYVDGDGCLSFADKNRKEAQLQILGTEQFLTELQHWLPLEFENKIYSKEGANVKALVFNQKRAFYVANYLYKDATLFLERKQNRYKEYCRLYLEEYGLQLGKYGELWEENTVVNSEITKGSESLYSVGIE
jgi:hypothetical protein